MNETVDARGLSCPQPVLVTVNALASMRSGSLEVLVDTEASKENVIRAAKSMGWEAGTVTQDGDQYRVILA